MASVGRAKALPCSTHSWFQLPPQHDPSVKFLAWAAPVMELQHELLLAFPGHHLAIAMTLQIHSTMDSSRSPPCLSASMTWQQEHGMGIGKGAP